MVVLPNYSKSIYNVPHTVLKALGIQDNQAIAGHGDLRAEKLILFLIDAMGMNVVGDFLGDGLECTDSITSIFPSTTSAVLLTVFTGLSPREHGILEWYMFYEEYGDIVKSILFSPGDSDSVDSLIMAGCDPSTLYGLPTIFEKLKSRGLKSSVYLPNDYVTSLFTRHMTSGARVVGYDSFDDALKYLRKDESDYVYFYTDVVDIAQHKYGTKNESVGVEIRRVSKFVREAVSSGVPRTAIITADHGQVDVLYRKILDFPGARVGGSPRDVFVYGDYQGDFEYMTRNKFKELLGPGKEHKYLNVRAPDYVILPGENEGVWYQSFDIKGMHGGISEEEMIIPLIIIER